MNKFRSLVSRKNSGNEVPTVTSQPNLATNGDSPEANVALGVRLFCESGGPNNTGEEVLHLPVIVDAAESSPAAAKEAAHVIRKFLGKNHYMRAYVQYNSIMLLRILADNPGATFTRNLDSKFVATVKELLRDGRDMSVQQILRETLDTFELQRSDDETLEPLITMWKNEKAKWAKRTGNDISSAVMQNHRAGLAAPPFTPGQQPHFPPVQPNAPQIQYQQHNYNRLPAPHELASRIEEAKTSSKLLTQVVQSTPAHEILSNDLIKEFAERCREASRSIQGYINADNPAPDEHTLLTLIETNDGIAAALSKHQRALLNARKVMSGSPPNVQQRDFADSQNTFVNGVNRDQTSTPPINNQRIPRAGPAPMLGMPKPPERLDNPFDDSNRSEAVADPRSDTTGYAPRGDPSTRALPPRQRHEEDEDEEEESPAPPRQYRF